ncbi:MAG: Wzy polymerase domain-containing protein [Proteobacteria bacterium]|nr:Wzy polymerase domain-containing protein [Pseudomonadota bacterium]
MLREKLQQVTLARISLTLVGLMWVLPFLNYRHQYPLTTFDQEWWSALLGVLATALLLTRDYWRQPQIPRIVQLPAALIALVLLQAALGLIVYFDQALLYLLYLLFGLLLMMLGNWLRACFGIEKLALVLAIFLLAGAESSALIGVLQHFRWHTLLDAVVVVKMSAGVYGNLAQPNHFADYIALGLISLGLLFQQRKLPAGVVVLLAIPLLFVMTLSGSRSSWLYLMMMPLLAWWAGRRMPALRPLLYYCLLVLAGFAAMHGIVQLPFIKGAGNNFDVMHRMFGDTASGDIRLYLWHEAWLMFMQSPWLGAGFGQFAWQHFQLGPVLRQANISGLYNNAHNLIFQLAAETGMAGLAVLFVTVGVWLHGLRRAARDAAHWWAYAILGVLAIHSLLEYPLWYLYFFAVAAILLGALDETHYRLELRNVGRLSMAAMLLMGFLSLLQLSIGYQRLKETLATRSGNVAQSFQRSRDGLVALQGVPLLSPYADLFMSSYFEVNADYLQTKLALNSSVIRFIPIAQVAYRQSYLLAQNGQAIQAQRVFEQAVWSYPDNKDAQQQLVKLAQKDPAHFAALLEFALKSEQEYASAIHNK